MKPVRTVLLRAVVLALLVLSLGANVARADDSLLWSGGDGTQSLPEDPGLNY